MRHAARRVNSGFFREHWLPLPLPKKPLKSLRNLIMQQSVSQVMTEKGMEVKGGKRSSGGMGRRVVMEGNFVPTAKNLPQIRSRDPEKTP